MTIVAYRDGIIAADSLSVVGDCRSAQIQKIIKAGRYIAGASGTAVMIWNFLSWVKAGARKVPDCFGADDDVFEGMLVGPDRKVWFFDESGDRYPAEGPFHALGSGAQVALGAMAHGASAIHAVEYACEWHTHCSPPVFSERLGAVRRGGQVARRRRS